MNDSRLAAPAEDGAVMTHPPFDLAAEVIARNRAALEAWQHDFQGRSSARVRAMARASVLDAARRYIGQIDVGHHSTAGPAGSLQASLDPVPLIVTGHQPELFHPGVWVKNFASHELARRYGGLSLHLIVDNDTVKKTTVRVPTGALAHPAVAHVPFDRWRGEIPYEEYQVADESLFANFGENVQLMLEPLGVRPLAGEFWKRARSACDGPSRLGECLARARRGQENEWGCDNLELPVSRLCQTEGFYWFAAHLLAQLGRFRMSYNQALAEYRQKNGIRSRNHPVPSLGTDGEWQEAPFWVWSDRLPRRRQLFVRQMAHTMTLTDREAWSVELPLAPDREACCAVEVLASLAGQGIRIRTRALTTTLFSRLCLGDLFIHGLGGARYDELTDQIIQQFFELEPPQFMVLTGTLRLPLPGRPGTAEGLHQLERRKRDLIYSPDRFLDGLADRPAIQSLVMEKRGWIERVPETPEGSRRRFEEIRRINAQLAPLVHDQRIETGERIAAMQADLAANTILRGRDWPFVAYPADRLRTFLQSVR